MSKARDIFVISDLHIGDGGPRDKFAVGNRRGELIDFLDYVDKNGGELFILGDLFEFWTSPVSKVIMSNVHLLDKMAKMEVNFIIGNHEADLIAFVGQDMLTHPFFKRMSGPILRTIGDKKFKFQHGHEADRFNSKAEPSWSRILSIFAGILEEKNGSPLLPGGKSVEEAVGKFGKNLLKFRNWAMKRTKRRVKLNIPPLKPEEELTPAQNPSLVSRRLLRRYRENRESEGYDIAIVGHTHQAGKLENEDWYYNSGSWAKKNNEFLTISPDGEIRFYQWEKQQAQCCKPVIKLRKRDKKERKHRTGKFGRKKLRR